MKLVKLSRFDIARITMQQNSQMAHQQSRHQQIPHQVPHQNDEVVDEPVHVENGYAGHVLPQGDQIRYTLPTMLGKIIFKKT